MNIDKEKLKGLLWAEAASYRADCADWKRNTEALDDFLGEKTVGEVALELLAENEALKRDIQSWRLSIEAERKVHNLSLKGVQDELDRLAGHNFTEELAALRKSAERYWWLRAETSLGPNIQVSEWVGPNEYRLFGEELDSAIDAAMGKGEQS